MLYYYGLFLKFQTKYFFFWEFLLAEFVHRGFNLNVNLGMEKAEEEEKHLQEILTAQVGIN